MPTLVNSKKGTQHSKPTDFLAQLENAIRADNDRLLQEDAGGAQTHTCTTLEEVQVERLHDEKTMTNHRKPVNRQNRKQGSLDIHVKRKKTKYEEHVGFCLSRTICMMNQTRKLNTRATRIF